ncbi:MAG: ATP synthase F1 subunit gamma [Bacteroidales bacterium]|nr:ATP synthase F1 subunit gamma [Bacteroidales bacterium]
MASLKEIKARIASVQSTLKITSAMKLVASAKLRKAQGALACLKEYRDTFYELLSVMQPYIGPLPQSGSRDEDVPFPDSDLKRERVAVVVLSSNTSLCGSYNANVVKGLKRETDLLTGRGNRVTVFPIGEKVAKYASKIPVEVCRDYVHFDEKELKRFSDTIAARLLADFINGTFDRIEVVYTLFHSASRHSVECDTLLPFCPSRMAVPESADPEVFIFEPSPKEIAEAMIPTAVSVQMHEYVLSAVSSEHASRMLAMQTATDNATKLLAELQLSYNKGRQQAITEELTDISNGKLEG